VPCEPWPPLAERSSGRRSTAVLARTDSDSPVAGRRSRTVATYSASQRTWSAHGMRGGRAPAASAIGANAASTDVSFLNRDEVDALLASPDRTRWLGRRDYVLLAVAAESGLRVSELIGLRCGHVELGRARTSAALARDGRHGARRSAHRRSSSWRRGYRNGRDRPPTRCSPRAAEGLSAGTRSGYSWPNTRMPHGTTVCRTVRLTPRARHSAAMNLLHSGVGATRR
jgi:integrase